MSDFHTTQARLLRRQLQDLPAEVRRTLMLGLLNEPDPNINRLKASGLTKIENFDLDWTNRTLVFWVETATGQRCECQLKLPKSPGQR